jgi:hypothetical protein
LTFLTAFEDIAALGERFFKRHQPEKDGMGIEVLKHFAYILIFFRFNLMF